MTPIRLLPGLLFIGLLLFAPVAGRAAGSPTLDCGVKTPPSVPQCGTPAPLSISADSGRIHPALRRALAAARPDDELPIIIEWKPAADPLAGIAAVPDRPAQRRQVVAALQVGRARESAALRATLAAALAAGRARDVRAFWIAPVIALRGRPDLIADLAGRNDVAMIRPDAEIRL
ncbi:MAG: hypothetical protein ACP5UQ_02530, partial [Anaerolineae bacterium]